MKKIIKRINQFTLLSIFALLLCACGFNLRSYTPLPVQISTLYLHTADPNNPFGLQLERNLRAAGVTLVESPLLAPYALEIVEYKFDKRLTTISGNTQVRSYRLILNLIYKVVGRDGKTAYGPKKATASSTLVTNDTQLLGDTDLLLQQQRTMIQNIVYQIIVQLSSEEAQKRFQVRRI